MNDAKCIGLDVHQVTICAAVLDSAGNLVMEAILEAKAETILQFLLGLRGSLQVTFEEGTWAAWLHDLVKPHVTRMAVCDTRKTDLGKRRNRNDLENARGLARLLYGFRKPLQNVPHKVLIHRGTCFLLVTHVPPVSPAQLGGSLHPRTRPKTRGRD